MEVIPVDDIMETYGKLSEEKKMAVTNLMESTTYVSMCAHDEQGKEVTLNWKADQPMSIHLIIGIILTGRSEYGRIWLDDLRSKISRLI